MDAPVIPTPLTNLPGHDATPAAAGYAPAPGEPAPLSPAHMRILTDARTRAKKVRRAARFAAASASTLAFFAAISLLFSLFGDRVALFTGIALAALTWNEFRGARLLGAFDLRGPRCLGWNQLILGLVIVVYAVWQSVASDPSSLMGAPSGSSGDPQVDELLASTTQSIGPLVSAITYGVYGAVGFLGALTTILTAWYYFSRAALIHRLVKSTPAWALQAMRIMG